MNAVTSNSAEIRVCIKFPEPTELGLRYLQSETESTFNVYPEADMLLSNSKPKSFSKFSEWGKGWADPEIRRQRLQGRKSGRKPRQKCSRQKQRDVGTVRGRLATKISKQKP
ncbi:hypothetical protein GIB67_006858 [Kingdonia uniflora]|uniref:Uncharacterized protein n=1 Tax=Kingdonia uniflora TaxID=39325 RepID=A0A7J7L030_9MAGN|nr:hypothetical protein GIB67_006858 [Kingdonia uniflora]